MEWPLLIALRRLYAGFARTWRDLQFAPREARSAGLPSRRRSNVSGALGPRVAHVTIRVQVAIIGGGPAGLLLSQLLHLGGVRVDLLERRSRALCRKPDSGRRTGKRNGRTAQAGGRSRAHATDALLHDGFTICFEGEQLQGGSEVARRNRCCRVRTNGDNPRPV